GPLEIRRLIWGLASSGGQSFPADAACRRAHPAQSGRATPVCFCHRELRTARDRRWLPLLHNAARCDSSPPIVAAETDCSDQDRLRVGALGLIVANGPAG